MSAEVIKEFLVSLGYKVDGSSEKKFKEAVRGATLQAMLLAKAVEEAAEAAVKAVAKIATGFDQLYWSSQRTNAAAGNIRAFAFAVSQMGGSVDGARSSIEGIGRAIRTNPGFLSMIRSLGVATQSNGRLRDTVEIMGDLGKALARKPYYVAAQYAQALGIDEQTLRAMMAGTDKWQAVYNERQKKLGLDPEKAAENANRFMQTFRNLQDTLETIFDKLAVDFSEPMLKAMQDLDAWLREHYDDIKRFVGEVAEATRKTAEAFRDLAVQLKPAWEGFDRLAKSLTGNDGLTAAFIGLGAVLSLKVLAPLTRIAALIAGMGALPAWLAGLLGVVATGHGYQTAEEYRNSPDSQAVGDAANARVGGIRSWWKRNMPRFLGGDGGSPEPITSGQRAENARKSYEFWRSAGLSHEAVAGILASQQKESGFNPGARGDGGAAHGLFQHHPDRRANILAGTGINMSTASVEDQLKGAHWEMTQGNDVGARKAWKVLNTPGLTPREYGAAFVHLFERPARDERAERGALAEKWAKEAEKWAAPDSAPQDQAKASDDKAPAGTGENAVGSGKATSPKPAFDPSRFDMIKTFGDRASLNASALTNSYLGSGSNVTNDNSNSITLHQKTEVNVIGSSNPGDTAAEVVRHQSSINAGLLRNAQGAVR